MKEMIANWVGKMVYVSLRIGSFWASTGLMAGKLTQVSDAGVLIEAKGQTFFVPIAHILHVSTRENT
jgi:hypothetical protein